MECTLGTNIYILLCQYIKEYSLSQWSGTYCSQAKGRPVKTASGTLACRQVLANFLQGIAKQQIPQEKLAKLTTDCHLVQLTKLVFNWKILWSHMTPMPNCVALMEIHFKI